MTIPENILIALGIGLIVSLMANAVFIGLVVAYVNTERDRLYRNMKDKRE